MHKSPFISVYFSGYARKMHFQQNGIRHTCALPGNELKMLLFEEKKRLWSCTMLLILDVHRKNGCLMGVLTMEEVLAFVNEAISSTESNCISEESSSNSEPNHFNECLTVESTSGVDISKIGWDSSYALLPLIN